MGQELRTRDIEEAVRIYEANGIVTRDDIETLDSRPYISAMWAALRRLGYEHVLCVEIASEKDYSGVLYNAKEYSYEYIEKYMKNYVLRDDLD